MPAHEGRRPLPTRLPIGFETAYGKAYGALALGTGSRSLMARAEQQPYFVTAAAAAIGGTLVPVPGASSSRMGRGGARLVGVSGDTSDNDELAAVAAITSASLVPQPD